MELDWQNSYHQIKERGQHLLASEKWADCVFLVGNAPNSKLISGHKLILAMTSPVFERMFYGNLPDETDPIVIPDVQPDAFMAMLDYIYSDRINISSFDKACELCYVAKKYMLPHVVEQCTHFLWADLSPKNACRAYEFAKLFDEPRLMQSSMEIIAANTREVLADPSFPDIEVSTLMAILDQHKLNIDSELDLFNGVLKYASERGMFTEPDVCPVASTSSASSLSKPLEAPLDVEAMHDHSDVEAVEEIKMEPDVAAMMHSHDDDDDEETAYDLAVGGRDSVRGGAHLVGDVVVVDSDASGAEPEVHHPSASTSAAAASANMNNIMDAQRLIMDEAMLRQAVKKIRFLTLTPQQFAEGPARSKLLQQHEALAILIKISSPSINDCAMPEGFCHSRCSRNFYEPRCQRELSSYRHSVPSSAANCPASSCFAPIEAQPNALGGGPGGSGNAGVAAASAVHQPLPVANLNNGYNGSDSDLAATNDTRRSYCVRTVNQQFDYRNTSVTDCGLTFQVDTNIWITGVQVPTQVLCGELMNSAGFSERYMEILYAHIQDIQGSRLTYTHCTSRVRYDSLLEISFDRPVYIYRNQIYKVFVVFNKVGWYPMYTCVPDVICNRVKFMFNVGNPSESVRDGLIRAIVFSTPQEQSSRNMIE